MALINPRFVQSTLKLRDELGTIGGTGFLYARTDQYNSNNPEQYWQHGVTRMWLVTCAHVVDGITEKSRVHIEMNKEEAGKLEHQVVGQWTKHLGWVARCSQLGAISTRSYSIRDAEVDVAVVELPPSIWADLDWWAFPPKVHMTKAMMSVEDISSQPLNEGDGIFIVGFPTGYYEDAKNWPVVRQGVIAQFQPYLRGQAETFLIDGSVFPGNSGGPVVTKPQDLHIIGTNHIKSNALVGMVSGHQLSKQENADLGIVVPLDTINYVIDIALGNSAQQDDAAMSS